MEVISPWTLYWILQLDSIISCITSLSVISLIATLVMAVFGCMERSLTWDDKSVAKGKALHRTSFKLAIVTAPLMLIASLLPSTKSMAAIVVIPAIANSTTIQTEAGELYDLAKQALRQAVTDNKPTKSTD